MGEAAVNFMWMRDAVPQSPPVNSVRFLRHIGSYGDIERDLFAAYELSAGDLKQRADLRDALCDLAGFVSDDDAEFFKVFMNRLGSNMRVEMKHYKRFFEICSAVEQKQRAYLAQMGTADRQAPMQAFVTEFLLALKASGL
jgi:hypothetical protein